MFAFIPHLYLLNVFLKVTKLLLLFYCPILVKDVLTCRCEVFVDLDVVGNAFFDISAGVIISQLL